MEERLDLFSGLLWLHVHANDMSTAISAASDGQQRRLADALRLNFSKIGAARPGGACPQAGRAAPTAAAVSTQADAGPPLHAEPGPADYSGRRPAALERLSSGRASRAAAIDVSPHAVAGLLLRAEPGPAVYSGHRPAALAAPVLRPGEPRRPLPPSQHKRMRARRSMLSRAS
jgi:hypothetical protein